MFSCAPPLFRKKSHNSYRKNHKNITRVIFHNFHIKQKLKQAFDGFLESLREEYNWLYEPMHAEDLATAQAGFSSAVASANTAPTRPAAQALAQPSGIRNKKLG